MGLLSNLRQLLYIPITQRACKRVSIDVFAHLLRLDHSYHLKRNTGKVMRILDRGTSSIQVGWGWKLRLQGWFSMWGREPGW